jgi:hypothetical protein
MSKTEYSVNDVRITPEITEEEKSEIAEFLINDCILDEKNP